MPIRTLTIVVGVWIFAAYVARYDSVIGFMVALVGAWIFARAVAR